MKRISIFYSPLVKPELALTSWLLFCCLVFITGCDEMRQPPIKIGILHSLTGTMAISESPVVDATLMAITEINTSGGLLGRDLQAVIVDGKSDWPSFAQAAEKLILVDKVDVIFGCWTSACRKSLKPIIEKYNHLLFYPVQYEGLEQSSNIIYTGSAPNQQLTPAVKWSVKNLGQRVFLTASDYVFPRAANTIMKKQIYALGASVVGEHYIPLGETNVVQLVDEISTSNANVILNTINGDSNLAFFEALSQAGITIPVMSFSIAEDELQSLDIDKIEGHYAAWNYFQSIKTPENLAFVARFKQAYGKNRNTSAPMQAAYSGVYLWSQAVKHALTVDPSTVKEAIKGQTFNSPEGKITVSTTNNHLWKYFYIGQIQNDGQFKIIWRDNQAIRPQPFPLYRTRASWQAYLDELYSGWGQSWAASPRAIDG